MIPNSQYNRENEYSGSIETTPSLLLDDVKVGDTLTVMMFGEDGYKIVATRTSTDWDIKLFRHPEFGTVFAHRCHNCDKNVEFDKEKPCVYCYLMGMPLKNVHNSVENRSIGAGSVSEIYQIGYDDGYNGKDLPLIKWGNVHKTAPKEIKKMYKSGYDAGKTKRELENRTEKFCTLLPNFLAQKKSS